MGPPVASVVLMATTARSDATTRIADNRRARHDYQVLETVEAGLVLQGSEVKSLRLGQVQLADAYARLTDGELWLEGVHIAPYQFAAGVGAHDPDRRRKLLLHRDEIDKLAARLAQERLTLVPLRLYFRDGRAKVELALARGRQKGDKRQAIAERDSKREMERALGRQRKGSV
jgi:SsrA-binding protein